MNESDSRLRPSIFDRDQFWVGSQVILFVASAWSGIRHLKRTKQRPGFGSIVLGAAPVVTAIAVASNAKREIGDNLTIAPTPVEDGYLVDTGVYGIVRHPLYLSAILILLGWALGTRAIGSLAIVPLGIAFFNQKAKHEEGLLRERYPQYDEYSRKVPGRILPQSLNGLQRD